MNARKMLLALTACPLVALAGGSPDDPDVIVTDGVRVIDSGTGSKVYYGVYDPGMLVFSLNDTFAVGGVVGNGAISNATGKTMQWSGGTASKPVVFAGTLANGGSMTLNGNAHVRFTNDAIDKSITWRIYGELGVTSIGMVGQPSAMGTRNQFWISDVDKPGTLLYLGTGEHTDKDVNFNRSGTLNAGADGGVVFDGTIGYSGAKRPIWIALTGENANPAVIAGLVDGHAADGTDTPAHFIKRGTGTWRFADVARPKMFGALSVEQGTLEYASIAETGTACSLGTATMLHEPIESTGAKSIPYACTIGNGTALDGFAAPADDLATFRYVGTEDARCTTRLIGVKGAGRLVNGSDKAFRWEGVTAADESSSTLVLDGSGASDSLASVSNGPGKVSIVKTGSGTWTLKNNLTFTGGLDVRGGTLKIGYGFYDWYRLTFKQIRGSGDAYVQLQNFVMQTAEGENVTTGMSYRDDLNGDVGRLQPGEAAYGHSSVYPENGNTALSRFFAKDTLYQGGRVKNPSPKLNTDEALTKPGVWVVVQFRLPSGSRPPVLWDFASRQANTRTPTSYSLEGSDDGQAWTTLTEVISNATITTSGVWFSNGQPMTEADHGYVIDSGTNGVQFLESVEYVAVSGGATLAADYPVSTSELRVAVDGNGGTIKGVSFAENGVIRLDKRHSGVFELPIVFEDVEGLANLANWQVKIGNRQVRRKVTVSDAGKVTLAPPGCILIFR